MSLDYAILGFLNYLPLSGYDLKKRLDQSVQHFWSADQSQIYRTLARLAENGWVEIEVVEQNERPDRKVYHITPAGRAALRGWLAGPFPEPEQRSAMLVQVFFSAPLSNEALREKFVAFKHALLQKQKFIEAMIGVIPLYTQEIGSPREAFCWMLTLELGQKSMQAQLEWIDSILLRIESGQIPEM